jgi:3'-phosphoadenosine 5'-phosphosulfate sulfotransferase (PAPS reductase)/FAD synthetase
MEFNAIARLGRKRADVVVQPGINFAEVVRRCGYPAISKQQARYLHDLQNPTERNRATRTLRLTGYKQDGTKGKPSSMLSRRYLHLIGGPRIGDGCCHHLKEAPLDNYSKNKGGSIPITGIQAEESDRRARDWINWGCVGLAKGTPKIAPMMIWRKTDVLEFVQAEKLEYCREIYGDIVKGGDGYTTTGEKRTGCVGCLFGCYHDPQRFVRLYKIDRPKWQYLMDTGAREVLAALGLPSYPGQYETGELFTDVLEAC